MPIAALPAGFQRSRWSDQANLPRQHPGSDAQRDPAPQLRAMAAQARVVSAKKYRRRMDRTYVLVQGHAIAGE